MQKSKVDWIKLGDGNNAYFYANLKDKNKKTTLHRLKGNQGNNLTEIKDMEKEVLRFYGEFNGTSLTQLLQVNIDAIRRGSQLKREHQDSLTQRVTETKIWKAMQGI